MREPAVGEANTVGFNELREGRDVLVCHIQSSCSALARTNPECPRIGSVAWTEMRNRLVSSRQVSKKDRLPILCTRDHPCCDRLPKAIAKFPLIGDKVAIFAVHEFIAMRLD